MVTGARAVANFLWLTSLAAPLAPGAVSARSSDPHPSDDNGQSTLFSAMIHGVGVTVAQIPVPAGTNEITQVQTLLAGIPAICRHACHGHC